MSTHEFDSLTPQALAGFWDDVKNAFRSNDAPVYLSKPRLSRGDQRPEVSELQTLLKIQPTGTFNAATENAVKMFQSERGMPTTGVVAEQEWAALLGEMYVPGARGTQTANTVTNVASAATTLVQSLMPPAPGQAPVTVESEPVSTGSWWPWILGGTAVVATGAAAYYFFVHKGRAVALANPWEDDEMDWDFGEEEEEGEEEGVDEEDVIETQDNPLALRGNVS